MLLLLLAACPNDNKVTVFNSDPTATIEIPTDGQIFGEDEQIDFQAHVEDREDDPDQLTLMWSSTMDGPLSADIVASNDGTVLFSTLGLSIGEHLITLLVTDTGGQSGQDTVTIVIEEVPEAPEITVTSPSTGSEARDDVDFAFGALVSDLQDTPDQLMVAVTSATDGDLCAAYADATGTFSCTARLTAGVHSLSFVVTDTDGDVNGAGAELLVRRGTEFDDDGDGWSEEQGDCDDSNATISPAADEIYNGLDDDCDGAIDEDTTGYDDDGDGWTELDGDCDDADPSTYPGADEAYDAADNDCDGVVDEDTAWYDDDGDGYSEVAGDCDDADPSSFPGGTEMYDGADNDCDGTIDEGTEGYDDDGDGYTELAGDCDDSDPEAYPGADEDLTDHVDQDCDGIAQEDFDLDGHLSISTGGDDCDDDDEYTFPGAAELETDPTLCRTDADEDGFGDDTPIGTVEAGTDCDDGDDEVNPDADEECDGADNDCDGEVDEQNADGCTVYYYDYDGDGYGSDSVSGACYCSPTGYYTSAYNTDCYDYNDDANPTVTTYSSSTRGDSSYDWNCDGKEEKYWKDVGECSLSSLCSVSAGWQSSVKSCGSSGSYISGCSFDWSTLSCVASTGSYTQRCR